MSSQNLYLIIKVIYFLKWNSIFHSYTDSCDGNDNSFHESYELAISTVTFIITCLDLSENKT